MLPSVALGDMNDSWLIVTFARVRASGNLVPRLFFDFQARVPRERAIAELHDIHVKLSLDGEHLGEGAALGASFRSHEIGFTVEIPVSRAALQHVVDNCSGATLDLDLDFAGWLRVRYEELPDERKVLRRLAPDEWGFVSVGSSSTARLRVQVARSDWFRHVMQPVGSLDYILTEIPLPKGDAASGFLAPLNHLAAAEAAYAAGDDQSVFAKCHGAIEALPGYPNAIHASASDSAKGQRLDKIMFETSQYLHSGRHVAKDGELKGEFPVDHADARFALSLTRLLIAETARATSRGLATT